ncbi:hypothetical protein [Polaribacter glomeratus]|uniref:Uncharacterized protein n=1 Tax=Polaribacter glomeratus TaxID=102 RepID=A0A2S7WXS8_9FLAO|nr:hypothetical protein [Polaribacter glomeratus]PQJ82377.1 hypothetical protein BTO16_07200 [Polaribacter glomeratus]TXD64523.1 hypothetical protein ESX12_14445 [Polaribacter glomeratus]
MKLKTPYFFILFISILFLQCSPRLNYLGNYSSPTENVSIFFNADEIDREYAIMGLLNTVFVPSFLSSNEEDITNSIINKAKKVGADAVLITRFSNERYQELAEDINTKQVVTQNTNNISIEAKFLKFKD